MAFLQDCGDRRVPSLRSGCQKQSLLSLLQGFHMFFKSAGILALGFEVGLELLDQALEAQDLELEFLQVHCDRRRSGGASGRGGRNWSWPNGGDWGWGR